MIIQSILDTDLYKFTMGQVVFHRFPDAIVKYKFKCRNKNVRFTPLMVENIEEAIRRLDSLHLGSLEIAFLESIGLFKPSYIEFLRLFRFNSRYVKLTHLDGSLDITIEGPWFTTIYFEVPILAIVSQVYNSYCKPYSTIEEEGIRNLLKKIEIAKEYAFPFADFGTRRRFSFCWHEKIIQTFSKYKLNFGTSNVFFAWKYGLKPLGTMAHEFLQAAQQLGPRVKDSQKFALQTWADEYRGQLGIALSDVVGMDAFLRDFDPYFCKLFDGARHDSGDPYEWCEKLIKHYKKYDIDPLTKAAVFSDGLDFEIAAKLYTTFQDKIKISFGIGTNLTNDVGVEPLNIVLKMVECNGNPVAKISDSPGKQMCEDESYLQYLKTQFNI